MLARLAVPPPNPSDERLPWERVERAVRAFAPAALEARVHEWIDEFAPPDLPRVKGRPVLPDLGTWRRRVDLTVGRGAGEWYGRGPWRVGNETTGACLCHGFAFELATTPRSLGVARATAWVLDEVQALARYLRALSAAFELVEVGRAPEERAVRLSLALSHALEVTVEHTACAGAWAPFALDAVAWTLDRHGVVAPPVLRALVEATVTPLCEPSRTPPRARVDRLFDDLAAVVVHGGL